MTNGPTRVRRGVLDPHQWRLWLSGLVGARYDGLMHFHVVTPGVLMRCGQPRVADLEYIRAEHRLSTVVVARGGTRHPLRGRWYRKERQWCALTGVNLVHMPFSDAATPPTDAFDRFISIMQDPKRQPVLVHCEQGFHRTGILCAAYRVAVEGWSFDRALEEMRAWGFDTQDAKRQPLVAALRAWVEQRPHSPAP